MYWFLQVYQFYCLHLEQSIFMGRLLEVLFYFDTFLLVYILSWMVGLLCAYHRLVGYKQTVPVQFEYTYTSLEQTRWGLRGGFNLLEQFNIDLNYLEISL